MARQKQQRRRRDLIEPARVVASMDLAHSALQSTVAPTPPVATDARFGHNFSQVSVEAPAVQPDQAGREIGPADDQYEQEADRVAEQILYVPEPPGMEEDEASPPEGLAIQQQIPDEEETDTSQEMTSQRRMTGEEELTSSPTSIQHQPDAEKALTMDEAPAAQPQREDEQPAETPASETVASPVETQTAAEPGRIVEGNEALLPGAQENPVVERTGATGEAFSAVDAPATATEERIRSVQETSTAFGQNREDPPILAEGVGVDASDKEADSALSTIRQWQGRVRQATERIPEADLQDVGDSPQRLAEQGHTLNNQRQNERPNYLARARQKIPPAPEPEVPPPAPEPDPVPEATNLIRIATTKQLPDQSLTHVTRSPGHPQINGGRGRLPALTPEIARDESKLPQSTASETDGTSQPNPNAEKLKQELSREPTKPGPGTEGAAIVLRDGGVPSEKPLAQGVKVQIEDVLASLLAQTDTFATDFVNTAVDTAYPHNALRTVAPDIIENFVGPEKQTISDYLQRIADTSGIAEASLQQKVTSYREQIENAKETAEQGLQASKQEIDEETKIRGKEEQKGISQAAEAIELEIEQKQAATNDSVDHKVIEAKQKRLLAKLNTDVTAGQETYAQAGEKRKQELTHASGVRATAYLRTAQAETTAIRELYEDDMEGQLQARPSLDWGDQGAQETNEHVEQLKLQVDDVVQAYQQDLNTASQAAQEMIHAWATSAIGEERSWWDRLVDTFREWTSQARQEKEAWEQAEAHLTQDQLVADFQKLEEICQIIATGNQEAIESAMAGLTAQEQVLITAFFGSGGDSIQAVATGMCLRLKQQRVPKLIEVARKKSLELDDWQQLDELGRSQNPGFHASEVARRVYDAVAGIGTTEAQIYAALDRRTPVQIAAIKKIYKEKYETDIEDDLTSELSGEEEKRALRQLQGDHISADVAALREAIEGTGTDEATIMQVLRNKTPTEREQLVRRYKEEYEVDLREDLRGDLSGLEAKRVFALLEGDVAKADAIAIEDATQGLFGPDREAVEAVYAEIYQEVEAQAASHAMTTAEMEAEIRRRNQAVETAYEREFADGQKHALQETYQDEFAGPELDLIKGLHSYDPTAIDAARLRVETTALVTSDDTVNEILRKQHERAKASVQRDLVVKLRELEMMAQREQWPAEKLVAKRKEAEATALQDIERMGQENMSKVEEAYNAKYQSKYDPLSHGLRSDLTRTTSGSGEDMALDLLAQGGKLTVAQEVHYTIIGAGTHEEALKNALRDDQGRPRTKQEIDALRAEYHKRYGRDLDEDIMSDVSGRDEQDMLWALRGKPETAADMMALLEEKREWELEEGRGLMGSLFGAAETEEHALAFSYGEAKKAYADYEAAKKEFGEHSDEARQLKARFERLSGYVEGDIEQYRRGVDRVADYASTAAELTVVAAGVILGAIFTGGTGSAATLAAYAGVTAGASAATGIATRAAVKGGAYGWEDVAADAAVGGVDVAATVVTFGMAKVALQAGKLSRLAKGSVGKRIAAHFLAEGGEGAVGALPPVLAAALLNDQTWEGENPFHAILVGIGMGTGMGLGAGGALGSLGGIKAPEGKAPTISPDTTPTSGQAPKILTDSTADTTGKPVHLDPGLETPDLNALSVDPELTAALPRNLQRRVPLHVDPDLPGNTVQVHYDMDGELITNIYIRVGPTATATDIKLHIRTIRAMQRYAGLSGRVLKLIERLNIFIHKLGEPPVGSRAWEARLELDKLPRVIKERLNQLSKGGLDTEAEASMRAEIASLEAQLTRHKRILDAMDQNPGRGYVAAEDESVTPHSSPPQAGPTDAHPPSRPGDFADEPTQEIDLNEALRPRRRRDTQVAHPPPMPDNGRPTGVVSGEIPGRSAPPEQFEPVWQVQLERSVEVDEPGIPVERRPARQTGGNPDREVRGELTVRQPDGTQPKTKEPSVDEPTSRSKDQNQLGQANQINAAELQRVNTDIDRLLQEGTPIRSPKSTRVVQAQQNLRDGNATPDDFHVLLQQAISDANNYNLANIQTSGDGNALTYDAVRGNCGPGRDCSALSVASLALESNIPVRIDRHHTSRVFEIENNHSFAVVTFLSDPPVQFLVDPTFGQFMSLKRNARVTIDNSADILRGDLAESNFAQDLLTNGFVPIDSQTAAIYVRALAGYDQQKNAGDFATMGQRLVRGENALTTEVLGRQAGEVAAADPTGLSQVGPHIHPSDDGPDILSLQELLEYMRTLIGEVGRDQDPAWVGPLNALLERLKSLPERLKSTQAGSAATGPEARVRTNTAGDVPPVCADEPEATVIVDRPALYAGRKDSMSIQHSVHIAVGEHLTSAADGHAILRRLADGDAEALRELGIKVVPRDFDPRSTEWGLGQLSDGTIVVVKGNFGGVNWNALPDLIPLAHSHPLAHNRLLRGDDGSGLSLRELIGKSNNTDKVHAFPSAADVQYVVERNVALHTVHTPYVHRGGDRIGNPQPDAPGSGISFDIVNPELLGYSLDAPVYKSTWRARHGEDTKPIWEGEVYSCPHPYIGSIIQSQPINVDVPAGRGGTSSGGSSFPKVQLGQRLSATGHEGSLAAWSDEYGAFEAKLEGKQVVVKVYPDTFEQKFKDDLAGAKVASRTPMGPECYGQVDVGPSKLAFAMEHVPGGFTHAPRSTKSQALRGEADHYAKKVGEHTLDDVREYGRALRDEHHYIRGDLQGLVDDNGRWRPIDFQSIAPLAKTESDSQSTASPAKTESDSQSTAPLAKTEEAEHQKQIRMHEQAIGAQLRELEEAMDRIKQTSPPAPVQPAPDPTPRMSTRTPTQPFGIFRRTQPRAGERTKPPQPANGSAEPPTRLPEGSGQGSGGGSRPPGSGGPPDRPPARMIAPTDIQVDTRKVSPDGHTERVYLTFTANIDGQNVEWGRATIRVNQSVEDNPPELELNTRVEVGGQKVTLKLPEQQSFTRIALDAAIKAYKDHIHRPPKHLGGELFDSNLWNFQREYAKLRVQNPQQSREESARAAVGLVSFGRHRREVGYGRIEIDELGDDVLVDLGPDLGRQSVPSAITVDAFPTTRSAASGPPGGASGGRPDPVDRADTEQVSSTSSTTARAGERQGPPIPASSLSSKVQLGQRLSASGEAGSLAGLGAEYGVFEGALPDGTPVAVKVYPEVLHGMRSYHDEFKAELDGAAAAEKTSRGPKFYGEVYVGPNKLAFAMERVPGAFPDASETATPAQKVAAARARTRVNEQTLRDLDTFSEELLVEGYYYHGEIQGLIDDDGRWKPIDFQSVRRLSKDPSESKQASKQTSKQTSEREKQLAKHKENVDHERHVLANILEQNRGEPPSAGTPPPAPKPVQRSAASETTTRTPTLPFAIFPPDNAPNQPATRSDTIPGIPTQAASPEPTPWTLAAKLNEAETPGSTPEQPAPSSAQEVDLEAVFRSFDEDAITRSTQDGVVADTTPSAAQHVDQSASSPSLLKSLWRLLRPRRDLLGYLSSPRVRQKFRERFMQRPEYQQQFAHMDENFDAHEQHIEQIKQRKPEYADIPTEDLVALHAYTSSANRDINSALGRSSRKKLKQLDSFIKAIASALTQLKSYQGTVYRGKSLTEAQASKYVDNEGGVVTEEMFFSTDKEYAFEGNAQFTVISKNGKPIEEFSQHPDEKEVLFAPGTRFRVRKARRDHRGHYAIELEEL